MTEETPITPLTSYLTNDTLGSPRVITDSSGNIESRRDFMPFGEEISAIGGRTSGLGYQGDNIRQKFTGYERDNETDLDFAQARMYASKLGRFSGVNPFNPILGKQGASNLEEAEAEFANYISQSQHWNRYAYSLNNPLKFTDPDGFNPITVKLNIIFDVSSNYTEEEKEQIKNTYVADLQNTYKDVNINFEVTYNVGWARNQDKDFSHDMAAGVVQGAINAFFSKESVGSSTEVTHENKGEIWIRTKDGESSDLVHGMTHTLGIAGGKNGYADPGYKEGDGPWTILGKYIFTSGKSAEDATVAIVNQLYGVASGKINYREKKQIYPYG